MQEALMRLNIEHELMRFGFSNFEESMMSAKIYEESINNYKKQSLSPGVITVGEMKQRFNDISQSYPDGKEQRFDDNVSDEEEISHYVINQVIAGVIKEALNQAKDPRLFEIRFLPIIDQLVDKFYDILDSSCFTIEEAKEKLTLFYSNIGTSYLFSSCDPIDKKDAIDKIESASIRAANSYKGQFNHLPKIIEEKILLQYGAKLSRKFVKRKKYPVKHR
jgi:hypothetical protein